MQKKRPNFKFNTPRIQALFVTLLSTSCWIELFFLKSLDQLEEVNKRGCLLIRFFFRGKHTIFISSLRQFSVGGKVTQLSSQRYQVEPEVHF